MLKLAQLAIQGDYDQVRQLATADLVATSDKHGRTVLMLAADADWTPQPFAKCIEYLMYVGADPRTADLAGNTAAHVAAARNHVRMLALLPFDTKWLENKMGVTPLMEAVQKGSWQCAKHLLHLFRQIRYSKQKSKLLEIKNCQMQTALDIARATHEWDLASIIKLEIRLGIDENNQITGLTSKEMATREELDKLISAGDLTGLKRVVNRVNCDLPDSDGLTALMSTVERNKPDCNLSVQLLLENCSDVTCADVHGLSCLHWAASKGGTRSIQDLVAAGAPTNTKAHGEGGKTPLMLAASFAAKADAAAIGLALISAGADWSLRDCLKSDALDIARHSKRRGLADLLREYKGKDFFDVALELTDEDRRLIESRRAQLEDERRKREEIDRESLVDMERMEREREERRRHQEEVESRKHAKEDARRREDEKQMKLDEELQQTQKTSELQERREAKRIKRSEARLRKQEKKYQQRVEAATSPTELFHVMTGNVYQFQEEKKELAFCQLLSAEEKRQKKADKKRSKQKRRKEAQVKLQNDNEQSKQEDNEQSKQEDNEQSKQEDNEQSKQEDNEQSKQEDNEQIKQEDNEQSKQEDNKQSDNETANSTAKSVLAPQC